MFWHTSLPWVYLVFASVEDNLKLFIAVNPELKLSYNLGHPSEQCAAAKQLFINMVKLCYSG